MNENKKLINEKDISPKYFWYLVNKQRKPKQQESLNPIKDAAGKLLTDPQSIAEEWRSYFQDRSHTKEK